MSYELNDEPELARSLKLLGDILPGDLFKVEFVGRNKTKAILELR